MDRQQYEQTIYHDSIQTLVIDNQRLMYENQDLKGIEQSLTIQLDQLRSIHAQNMRINASLCAETSRIETLNENTFQMVKKMRLVKGNRKITTASTIQRAAIKNLPGPLTSPTKRKGKINSHLLLDLNECAQIEPMNLQIDSSYCQNPMSANATVPKNVSDDSVIVFPRVESLLSDQKDGSVRSKEYVAPVLEPFTIDQVQYVKRQRFNEHIIPSAHPQPIITTQDGRPTPLHGTAVTENGYQFQWQNQIPQLLIAAQDGEPKFPNGTEGPVNEDYCQGQVPQPSLAAQNGKPNFLHSTEDPANKDDLPEDNFGSNIYQIKFKSEDDAKKLVHIQDISLSVYKFRCTICLDKFVSDDEAKKHHHKLLSHKCRYPGCLVKLEYADVKTIQEHIKSHIVKDKIIKT